MIEYLKESKPVLGLLISGFIIAFTMSVGMGANDVANAFGTTYGAKLLSIMQIVIIASIFEICGALLIGTNVADTIRRGIVNETYIHEVYFNSNNCISKSANFTSMQNLTQSDVVKLYCPDMINMIGSVSSLTGSSIWMMIANLASLPVSTTHSIVGSYIGYGLAALHGSGIYWRKLIEIVISWFLSPCASGIISITIWMLIYHTIIKSDDSFNRGLKIMPFLYFVTSFIIVFSILYKGTKLLYFDKIPLYLVFIISIVISLICYLLVLFIKVPILRKRYLQLKESSSLGEIQVSSESFTETNNCEALSQKPKENSLTETKNTGNTIDNISEEANKAIAFSKYKDEDQRTSYIFRYMQIIIACYGSFAHGGNDVSNTAAPLITIWMLSQYGGSFKELSNKEIWILAYGAVGIIIGLALWGKRVLKTVGNNITTITPTIGYSIELGSVITVVVLTRLGVPVSTTHCKIGSLILLGMVKYGRKSIKRKLIISILLSWLVTVPVSGIISAAVFVIIQRIIFSGN